MDDIADIEERLGAALGRIGAKLEALRAPAGEEDESEVARLSRALEDEREAMAQIEARYDRLRRRHLAEARRHEVEVEAAEICAEAAEERANRLAEANERLREAAETVRVAALDGGADGIGINRLMREEIVSLRDARQDDRDALDALMEKLAPLAEGEDDGDEEKDA